MDLLKHLDPASFIRFCIAEHDEHPALTTTAARRQNAWAACRDEELVCSSKCRSQAVQNHRRSYSLRRHHIER